MKTHGPILLLIFLLTSYLPAQTIINEGDVFGTWTADSDPYRVYGDITIPDDSTLTIEPDVLVEFQKHAGLWVQGRLLAVGTETDSIIFTVADTSGFGLPDTSGGWYGIRFIDTPTSNDSSHFAYCRLEYGKAIGDVWPFNAGGAMCVLNFSKISIEHCLFRYNYAGGPEQDSPAGGALHLVFSDIFLYESLFLHNQAVTNGGSVYGYESDLHIHNTRFMYNAASYGGAILIRENSLFTLVNCVFAHNQASEEGGALNVGYHSAADLDQVSFSHNTAIHGGAVMGGYAELLVSDCTFEYNQVSDLGAALSLDSCQVGIEEGIFYHNSAGVWGGGIHTFNCELNLVDCLFLDNDADDLGGGIHADFSELTGQNVSFIGNSASLSGGLHCWYTDLQISDSRFEQNTATSSGAGIHGDFSQLAIDSTTFYDNQADWGTAVQVFNCDLQIACCSFDENSALNGAGAAIHYYADSTIFEDIYQVQIEQSQFTRNTASGLTAGVYIDQTDIDTSLADIWIDHCQFRENHSLRFSPLRISRNFSGIQLTNSVFQNNTSTQWVAGPAFVQGASGTIENCVSTYNYANYSDSTTTSSCATLNHNATAAFINCVFTDTSETSGYGISLGNGSVATLINTNIWGCGTQPVYLHSSTDIGSEISFYYCNIENGMDSVYTTDTVSTIYWGEGNIALDPHFVDLIQGDLHLQDDSPLIGAGVSSLTINDIQYDAPGLDIEGTARPSPQGTSPDIGAYENTLGEPAAIADNRRQVPRINQLYQNYPNPFNPTTAIGYQLSAVSHVQLTIYNLLGQKVVTLVDEQQAAGFYQVQWDAVGLASGVYVYRIQTDRGFQESKKLLLLR